MDRINFIRGFSTDIHHFRQDRVFPFAQNSWVLVIHTVLPLNYFMVLAMELLLPLLGAAEIAAYIQSTYIKRVPQCMSPRWNCDSPTPSLANECAPSPGTKEGGAGEG